MSKNERVDVENCISSLLTSNPVRMSVKDVDKDFYDMIGYRIPYKKFGFNSLESYLRSIPDRVRVIGDGCHAEVRVVITETTAHLDKLICNQKVPKGKKVSRKGLRKFCTIRAPYRSSQPSPRDIVQREQTNQINESRLESPEDANNNKCDVLENKQSASRLSPTSSKSDYEPESCDTDDMSHIPIYVKETIRKIIVQHPEGILCSRLPNLFEKLCGKQLTYSFYGYRSVAEMCVDLGYKYEQVEYGAVSGDVKVFDRSVNIPLPANEPFKSTLPKESPKQFKNNEPALPENIEDILLQFHNTHLDKRIQPITHIATQWISPSLKIDDYIDVNVAEVYDPSKFWMQLKEHAYKLDQMMDQMQLFYGQNKATYELPYYALKEGMYVACVYEREYHRAKIIDASKTKNSLIKVFFIDYGTVATIYTTSVCYLDEDFTGLPAQAIRARLSGIYPKRANEPWSMEAAGRFLNMVASKHLVAQIKCIREKEQLLDLILADTSVPGEDFYINDALVYEKYAIFTYEEQEPPILAEYTPLVRYLHLFPTHREIETGEVPSFSEMMVLAQTKISIDRIIPSYFRRNDDWRTNSERWVESKQCQTETDEAEALYDLSWADKIEKEEQKYFKNFSNRNCPALTTDEKIDKECQTRIDFPSDTQSTNCNLAVVFSQFDHQLLSKKNATDATLSHNILLSAEKRDTTTSSCTSMSTLSATAAEFVPSDPESTSSSSAHISSESNQRSLCDLDATGSTSAQSILLTAGNGDTTINSFTKTPTVSLRAAEFIPPMINSSPVTVRRAPPGFHDAQLIPPPPQFCDMPRTQFCGTPAGYAISPEMAALAQYYAALGCLNNPYVMYRNPYGIPHGFYPMMPVNVTSRTPTSNQCKPGAYTSLQLRRIGGITFHLIDMADNMYFDLQELIVKLVGASISNDLIRKYFATTVYQVDIIAVSLQQYPELRSDLLRNELIKEDTTTINIVPVSDAVYIVEEFRSSTISEKISTFLAAMLQLVP